MLTGAIEAPKRLEDLHVRRALVASLLLRTIAFADQLSGAAIETRLGLPFETLQPIIEEFQKSQLTDTMGFSNQAAPESRCPRRGGCVRGPDPLPRALPDQLRRLPHPHPLAVRRQGQRHRRFAQKGA